MYVWRSLLCTPNRGDQPEGFCFCVDSCPPNRPLASTRDGKAVHLDCTRAAHACDLRQALARGHATSTTQNSTGGRARLFGVLYPATYTSGDTYARVAANTQGTPTLTHSLCRDIYAWCIYGLCVSLHVVVDGGSIAGSLWHRHRQQRSAQEKAGREKIN